MTIAITGSVAFDYIMSFPGSFTEHLLPEQLEKLSVSFLVDSLRRERGGVAGNIAYTMALLGHPCLLMASVGNDAETYINQLQNVGVDVSGIKFFEDEFTSSFFVSTDQQNRQIASFFIGAMGRASEIHFHEQDYQQVKLAIISPNAPDAMDMYVDECQEFNIPYVYDPSQQIPRSTCNTLRHGIDGAYMLIANDYELELIKDKTRLSLDTLKGMVKVLIVTRGKEGSTIYTEGERFHVPIVPVERIADPTGVGDAYRAGLLAGHGQGLGWQEAGQVGSIAAAYVLEQVGTQKHNCTKAEFAQRYFQHFERTPRLETFFEV